jgi:hypothetical protein
MMTVFPAIFCFECIRYTLWSFCAPLLRRNLPSDSHHPLDDNAVGMGGGLGSHGGHS